MTEEQPLAGGGGAPILRVGDTVRRPAAPWTPSVHALLRHLRKAGFEHAPLPLGLDERGREVVSYLRGEVWNYPLPELVWSDATLIAAARLLRALHDATVDFRPPVGAVWMLDPPSHLPAEVMCHNDFAPYNAVFAGGELVGIIDFDTASPGPRVWDVAYSAYRFVPLSTIAPPALLSQDAQAERLTRFCDAYGLCPRDRALLVPTAVQRVAALHDRIVQRAAHGDPVCLAHLEDGHADLYAADVTYLTGAEEALAAYL